MDRRFNDNISLHKFSKDPPAVYRYSEVGKALRETLDELSKAGKINPFMEHHTLKVFDHLMADSLSKFSKKESAAPVQFNGNGQDRHNFIDGCWRMYLRDVVIGRNSENPVVVRELEIMADNWSDKSVEQRKTVQALSGNAGTVRKRK